MDDLINSLGCDVDIVDATALKKNSAFIEEIEKDGTMIYERRSDD